MDILGLSNLPPEGLTSGCSLLQTASILRSLVFNTTFLLSSVIFTCVVLQNTKLSGNIMLWLIFIVRPGKPKVSAP